MLQSVAILLPRACIRQIDDFKPFLLPVGQDDGIKMPSFRGEDKQWLHRDGVFVPRKLNSHLQRTGWLLYDFFYVGKERTAVYIIHFLATTSSVLKKNDVIEGSATPQSASLAHDRYVKRQRYCCVQRNAELGIMSYSSLSYAEAVIAVEDQRDPNPSAPMPPVRLPPHPSEHRPTASSGFRYHHPPHTSEAI